MSKMSGLWNSMLAKRSLSILMCGVLAVTSTGVCVVSATDLMAETRAVSETAAGGSAAEDESAAAENSGVQITPVDGNGGVQGTGNSVAGTQGQTAGARQNQTAAGTQTAQQAQNAAEEPEETGEPIHEFTQTWVGYEASLKDFIADYEPGDEVRISASFDKPVGSQFGMYIDGTWSAFGGEGKKRNITLIPDSDYINIQITDMKGAGAVTLTGLSAELVKKGEQDAGSYLHRFTGLWQGFETKFSDYNPDYSAGDEVKVTVVYNKKVTSQIGFNQNGEWTTESGDGTTLTKTIIPDNDYLNIQISDMWASYSVGVVSVSVEITRKGVGGGGAGLTTRKYTQPGDYHLFTGGRNEGYTETDAWINYCADTDYLTLTYDCLPEHESWGVLAWNATIDGQWTDGPSYSADGGDSTKVVTKTFSVKFLRKMFGITDTSNVTSLGLGCWSEGQIIDLTLHVGSQIPRGEHLFENGEVNKPWVCDDIEYLLDLPDDKYICVKYTCTDGSHGGWTVMNWGASVNGEWKDGSALALSDRPTSEHIYGMRMSEFRKMLGISWDVKVDTVQMSVYNEGRILDIWISDTPVQNTPTGGSGDSGSSDGGSSRVAGPAYESPNKSVWDEVFEKVDAGGSGVNRFTETVEMPEAWNWGNISEENVTAVKKLLKEGSLVVVDYAPSGAEAPSLQFTMTDGRQFSVPASYVKSGKAGYSYDDIALALSGYLVPQEILNIQLSAGGDAVTVSRISVVTGSGSMAKEPIKVLSDSWSGFETTLSKWNAGYENGDQVSVTVTFDKSAPGDVVFNGDWSTSNWTTGTTFTRTAVSLEDKITIRVGELPSGAGYVAITDIKVEITGKKNYDDCVEVSGDSTVAQLADTKESAAQSVLTEEEINEGTKLVLDVEPSSLTAAQETEVKNVFASEQGGDGAEAPEVRIASVINVELHKVTGSGRSTDVTETNAPLSIKVPVPADLESEAADLEFGVVRGHENANGKIEYTFLEDKDSNPLTVTFESDLFSTFTLVYGETGAFDGASGAIKVFRTTWTGFDTTFSAFKEDYKAGYPTTVTLTFDRAVKSYVDYHSPDFTREPSEFDNAPVSATYTATILPKDDSLSIGIADMNGGSMVKLLSVKIEQEIKEIEALYTFEDTWGSNDSTYNVALSELAAGFAVGDTVKVTAVFDQKAKVKLMANGCTEYFTDGNSETVEWEITPTDDGISIQAADAGQIPLHLLSIKAEIVKKGEGGGSGSEGGGSEGEGGDEPTEPVDPANVLHTFTSAWTGFDTAFTTYNPAYEAGKETTVTLTFDKEVGAQIYYHGSADPIVGEEKGTETVLTFTPPDDYMSIQLTDMAGNTEVKLLGIKVEQEGVEEPPVEALYTFEKTYGSDGSTYNVTLSELAAGFAVGDTVKVTAVFDQMAKVKMMANGCDDYNTDGSSETVEWEITPTGDGISIQAADASQLPLKLLSIKAEIVNKGEGGDEPADALFIFKGTWGGNNSTFNTTFSAYNENFASKKETTVTLTFDVAVQAKIQSMEDEGNKDGIQNDTPQKEIVFITVPTLDKLDIQIANLNGNAEAKLLSVKVEQKNADEEQKEALFTFTKTWGGDNDNTYSKLLSELVEGFAVGETVRVTAVFDKEATVKMMSGDVNYTSNGSSETVEWECVPKEDKISIQAADESQLPLRLLSITVEIVNKEEGGEESVEALYTFKSTWGGEQGTFETTFSEYNAAFQTGRKTIVTLTFDTETGVKIMNTGAPESEESTDAAKVKTMTLTPAEDKMLIQVSMLGENGEVNLLNIKVEQEEAGQHIATILSTDDKKEYGFSISENCVGYQSSDEVTVTVTLSSDGEFSGRLGCNVKDLNWQQIEFAGDDQFKATVEWTFVSDGNPSIAIWSMSGTVVYVDSVSVVKTDAQSGSSLNGVSLKTAFVVGYLPASPADAVPADEKLFDGEKAESRPDSEKNNSRTESETPDIPKNAILPSGDHSDDSQDE